MMMMMMISVIRWGGHIRLCGFLFTLRECVGSYVLSAPDLSLSLFLCPLPDHPHGVRLV